MGGGDGGDLAAHGELSLLAVLRTRSLLQPPPTRGAEWSFPSSSGSAAAIAAAGGAAAAGGGAASAVSSRHAVLGGACAPLVLFVPVAAVNYDTKLAAV